MRTLATITAKRPTRATAATKRVAARSWAICAFSGPSLSLVGLDHMYNANPEGQEGPGD